MSNYKDIYNEWLQSNVFDDATKAELSTISDNEKEIEERFYKTLEFGTGGLRGIIGAGTNRMNIYTVKKATQGLANYILKQKTDAEPAVAISFDCRNMSPEFASEAALTLCANGIKAYVFEALRPTPELSFAVRHLGCTAGIMITASHNPKEYNGYKAYWSDGGQVPYPRDAEIIDEVNAIASFGDVKTMPIEEAKEKGLYIEIGTELDDEYIKNVKQQSICPEITQNAANELKIVYTPFNGTGNMPVRRALAEAGFKNVTVVPEQELPDGNFTTVGYPNPEDPKAFALAQKLALEIGADLVIATDPDADRVGVLVKNSAGEYMVLTGNMTGVILTEYILGRKKAKGLLPENAAVVSTIVSTDLTKEICSHYGVKYFDVLTGFKYIGEKIKEFEIDGSYSFQFGFEESYGYLAGTYARDKDAVSACMLICEAAAYYKTLGKSLYEGLTDIYEKYGYTKEGTHSVTLQGKEGIENMQKIMAALRGSGLKVVGDKKITKQIDYSTRVVHDMELDIRRNSDLPAADVLYYTLSDDSWFCIRPSGTEPKIKVYCGVRASSEQEANEKYEKLSASVMPLLKI